MLPYGEEKRNGRELVNVYCGKEERWGVREAPPRSLEGTDWRDGGIQKAKGACLQPGSGQDSRRRTHRRCSLSEVEGAPQAGGADVRENHENRIRTRTK